MSNEKTGGPAFPRPTSTDEHIEPCTVEIAQDGMTLRQYYKAMALQGLLASGPLDCDIHEIAHDAALHADAMLAEDREHEERGS